MRGKTVRRHKYVRKLWHSQGWINQAGLVVMTATGQTFFKPKWFESAQISDRLIVITFEKSNLWFAVSRSQFANEEDWQRAANFAEQLQQSDSGQFGASIPAEKWSDNTGG